MAMAISVTARAATQVNISGTVIASLTCVVNGEKPIEADFGNEVATTRIDGERYKTDLSYTLSCKNNVTNALRMKVVGAGASFNNDVLSTNKDELGIALQADGKSWDINSWLNFTYPNQPLLQAIPIKKQGGVLTGGEFIATATLMIDYR
ncbi:exotoxin [Serratia marcescens]|nr:exotoxin [Serratia marcescens]